ncbi:MAG: NmrA family NAD(P)-binding protein [Ignavibacteriales bacterium]|nr:NmrA family NAD(P)-binding protein [Ignavibacteriales bacterium]
MYVVIGATGNTGKIVAESLLAEGKKVRITGRSAEKAQELVGKGADFLQGDVKDAAFLQQAFTGAEAVYALIPPSYGESDFYAYQQVVVDALAAAIEKSGVKYVVTLSSLGAQLNEDTGVVYGLHYMEQEFNKIDGVNILHLRPSFFMENLFGQIPVIKGNGVMGSPTKADLRVPMIATKDIGAYAVKRLGALDFSGKSAQYLLGERDLTYNEIAKIIGAAIGKSDLVYVEFPPEGMIQAMMGMGASENMAQRMVKLLEVANTGRLGEGAVRDAESTTPTSIEDFAHTFAYVYNM